MGGRWSLTLAAAVVLGAAANAGCGGGDDQPPDSLSEIQACVEGEGLTIGGETLTETDFLIGSLPVVESSGGLVYGVEFADETEASEFVDTLKTEEPAEAVGRFVAWDAGGEGAGVPEYGIVRGCLG